MIEMAAQGQGELYQRGVAGDSYNTAVYLARQGLNVDYFTSLGDDGWSDDILARLQAEGISPDLVTRCPGRQPGLYVINNDKQGERQFSYWREQAPAREMFDAPVTLHNLELFYFTGITLAIARSGLENLIALLRQLRSTGCRIAFDPNYRPGLWDGLEQARQHYREILPLCDIALPTLEDETALWNIQSVSECRNFYLQQGVSELVVKGPELTAHVFSENKHWQKQSTPVRALDTTGAGDSFNAGYLGARTKGDDIDGALARAQQLSAAVVQHRGAILPRIDLP